jgi:hypothetical protein
MKFRSVANSTSVIEIILERRVVGMLNIIVSFLSENCRMNHFVHVFIAGRILILICGFVQLD